MTRPDHLFLSHDGGLYDTRQADWSSRPLRADYMRHKPTIQSPADIKAALRAGQTTDHGGYPLYFVTRDGDALSFAAVRDNLKEVLRAKSPLSYGGPHYYDRSWDIIMLTVNYEGDLTCAHSGEQIPTAYGIYPREDADNE